MGRHIYGERLHARRWRLLSYSSREAVGCESGCPPGPRPASLPIPHMHANTSDRPPPTHTQHIHTHSAMSSKHDKKKGKHQSSGSGGVSALLDVFSSSSNATMAAKTAEWEIKGDAGVVGDDVRFAD